MATPATSGAIAASAKVGATPHPSWPGLAQGCRFRSVVAVLDELAPNSSHKNPVAGLVPAIHVLKRVELRQERRGCPAQGRARGSCGCGRAAIHNRVLLNRMMRDKRGDDGLKLDDPECTASSRSLRVEDCFEGG